MQAVKLFFTKHWMPIGALLLLAVVLFFVYKAGKKQGLSPQIVSDTGTVSQADIDKSNSLAQRLKDDLTGWNATGHDDSIYNELIQSSNVVFALTLGKYKQLTGTSLIADINSDYFYGWDVIDNITQKANTLNLT